MNVNYQKEGRVLIIGIDEEIDQHTADKIRKSLDDEIIRLSPAKVVFDFKNISFMDSSGIGMVLGRYKLVNMLGGKFEIVNVNRRMQKIFDMSGVSRIIDIKKEETEGEKQNIGQIAQNYMSDYREINQKEERNEGVI